jgi:hypothetical protein
MKLSKNLGVILLAVWLIASGLISVLNISFPASGVILAILAIAAGVVLLVRPGSLPGRIGVILLAIWLIVSGLLSVVNISVPSSGVILALVAIAAGVLILLER